MEKSSSCSSIGLSILKLFLITILFAVLFAVFQALAFLVFKLPFNGTALETVPPGKSIGVMLIITFPSVILFVTFRKKLGLNNRSVRIPKENAGITFFKALAFSFALIGVITAGILYFNKIQLNLNQSARGADMAAFFIFFLIAAFNEELLLRALFLEHLLLKHKKWVSLVVSSSFFMMLHLSNPNLSMFGVINVFLAGILLGQLYIYNRRTIFFATAFHMGWNFFQGPVLGFAVSGMASRGTLFIQQSEPGSEWAQNNFGLEGSPICTVCSVLAIIIIEARRQTKSKHSFRIAQASALT